MIMPTKHTTIEQSLLGFACYLLQNISENNTVDLLWQKYLTDMKNGVYPVKQTFDNLLLALIFLYAIGVIEDVDGEIKKCN